MIVVAILKRRLREGKTYEDFRKAWYHGVGFGTQNRMLTALSVTDPREVIVIALTETSPQDAARLLEADAAERGASPLDEVIEPAIDRTFGILVAEDDFSAAGPLQYRPAAVAGAETDLTEIQEFLRLGAELLTPYLDRPADTADSGNAVRGA